MSSFAEVELDIIRWSEARKIIPNSTPKAQFIKLKEEIYELQAALADDNMEEIIDGIGDSMVCLINICALLDVNLVDCMSHAYEQIKNRTGTMGADGIFYKDK